MLNRLTRGAGIAARGLLALCGGLILTGCFGGGYSAPMWISGPLLTDGSGSSTPGGSFQGYEERLHVGPGERADLSFSLATLPSGAMRKVVISGATASDFPSAYNLLPDKVYSARLVLYVESVEQPGYLRIDGAYSEFADCFANEAQVPDCPQAFAGPPIATNADNRSQTLRITERGYYSFDVTSLIRHRVDWGYSGVLRVTAAADPGNGSFGSFEFASKERDGARFDGSRQPKLLVTLTDAAGIARSVRTTTSVQNVLSDPSVANRDFSQDDDTLANGAPDARAFALISQPSMLVPARAMLGQFGSSDYKVTLVTSMNSAFAAQAGVNPQIDWYRIPDFNQGGARITWNNGWSVPGAGAWIRNAPIRAGVSSQVLGTDISRVYIDALVDSYNTNTEPDFAIAGATNVQGPIMLDGRRQTGAGIVPEYSLVVSPVPAASNAYMVDNNDDTLAIGICVMVWDSEPDCETQPLSLRARIGQDFAPEVLFVNPRVTFTDGGWRSFTSQLNVAVPVQGPSVGITTDPDPTYQVVVPQGSPAGYQIGIGAANREIGAYTGFISLVGHNVRAEVHFENLPLPAPSLSGPARVTMPAGASSVTLPADAAQPFMLAVDDAIVNANIDDTTKWLFSSSDPSDTMPPEVQQTDGSIALPITFGSAGPRTITVTSKGDATVTATFAIVIDAEGTTTLAPQGAVAVYGQPVTLSALVRDHAGALVAAGVVEFMRGTEVLGSAPVVGGAAAIDVDGLEVGAHVLHARYGGDPGSYIAASESTPEDFMVDRATASMSITAPASIFVGESVHVGVTLAVVAPGAGTPTGTVVVDDGTGSCAIDLAVASGCTLTPVGAGTRLLSATYSGDAHFLATMAAAPLQVLERAVLALMLDDGRPFARYGEVVDYTFTLSNNGLGAAAAIPVDATLSAAFDGAAAQWQCFGAGAGASCAASGTGPLHDIATLPPGHTLTWLVSVPVRDDAIEGEATLTLSVGGPAPQTVIDDNLLVLLRDGFEAEQPIVLAVAGAEADKVIEGEAVRTFDLPPAGGKRFETVFALRGGGQTITVLRTWLDTATALVRLSRRDADGERISPWARADADATLAVGGLKPEQGKPVILLEGGTPPLAIGD